MSFETSTVELNDRRAASNPFEPIFIASSGCSIIQFNESAKSLGLRSSANIASNLWVRNNGISPTFVTTTGFFVNKYSPSFVGKPYFACRLSGRSNARIVASVRSCGILSDGTSPTNLTFSSTPNSRTNSKFPELSSIPGLLPIRYNLNSSCFFATNENAFINSSTPSLLFDAFPQYAIYFSQLVLLLNPIKRDASANILIT